MPEHYAVDIGGATVDFYIYVNVPGTSRAKVDRLAGFLRALPQAHKRLVYPVFAMHRKPGGRNGGGTWRPGEVSARFLGRSSNTHVPDADIQAFALGRGRGVIGLSEDRWLRPPGRIEFSLLHEVGHCVDYQLGLVAPGAVAEDFPGVTTAHCGGGNFMVRRAVEVYSRWICAPAQLFNEVPEGRTASELNLQLKAVLRRSPAFRAVPATWGPR